MGGKMSKTEGEIFQELTESERALAEKYKYSHYWVLKNIKDVMEGYKAKKLNSWEVVSWIDKYLNEL